MKKNIIIPLFLLISSGLLAQGIYNNGGKIVINTGASVNIAGTGGNYRNETNGTNGSIDLSGSLILAGNYTNNVALADVFTTTAAGSKVIFDGTTPQTIGGSTTATASFADITISNSSGIIAAKNLQVNGAMTFTAGIVDIGNNNFTFGASSTIAGTPSVSSMIIATGTGQVQKLWTGPGTFDLPVGDKDVTPEYSPVNMNFISGTFAPGAFTGLNLVNLKYPDPAITGSYINRYWNITQTGITAFVCDVLFQYQPADVTGTEADIAGLQVIPAPFTTFVAANTLLHQLTMTGLTSFGSYTGGPGSKILNLKLFIEGLYAGGGLMNPAKNGLGGNQYTGTTVDVISVELHDAVTYATLVHSVNNINLSNAGLATISVPVSFSNSYYLTIKHRNSIATVSALPVSLAGSTISYDFSTNATQAFGANLKNSGGVYTIYGGDVDQDGFVGVSDMVNVDNQSAAFGSGYLPEDIDGDGFVGISDMVVIDNNAAGFVSTAVPVP